MAITLVQEQSFTATLPGTTATFTMSANFTPGNMVMVAVMTDSGTAPSAVVVDGSSGTQAVNAANGATAGSLSVWEVQSLGPTPTAKVSVTWATGPTNVSVRVHEFTPQLSSTSWGTGNGNFGTNSSGPFTTSPTGSVANGMKVAALASSVASTGHSSTGSDTWVSYSLTAGACFGYYAFVEGCSTSNSTYTWTITGLATYSYVGRCSTGSGWSVPSVADSTLPKAHPGYTKPVIGRGRVPVVTPYRRDQPNGLDAPVVNGTRIVTGHVYDTSGAAVSGATVKLVRDYDDFEVATTTTNGAGLYAFVRDSQDQFTYYVIAYSTTGGGATQIHGTSDRGLSPQSDSSDQLTAIFETEF